MTVLRPVVAMLAALVLPALAHGANSEALGKVRQGLFATCFATEKDGWMVGELGRIFHTADGGATWERQQAGTKRPFLALACVDAQHAWIAGKEGIVYRTDDAGTTWTPVVTGSTRHIFTLAFPTAERGHAAGDFGTMVHTEDGGKTWTKQLVPPEVKLPDSALDTGVDPGDVNLYALAYGDATHAWVVGEFGTILASTDGGRSWTQQRSPIETTLFGAHFTDPRHGWAVGIDSMILRTDDGGTTWQTQASPIAQRSFYDVFVSGAQAWIVGSAGTVMKSSDGGTTWTVQPLPIELAANWIRSVWLTPTAHGLAVGSDGLVFRLQGAQLERLAGSERAL